MGGSSKDTLGWLAEWTEAAVTTAVRHAAPDLGSLPVELEPAPDLSSPGRAFSRAKLGEDVFVKVALSQPTARRIWHEAQMLELLGAEPGIAVPELLGSSRDPALLATRLISGGHPLDFDTVAAADSQQIDAVGQAIATFFSQLHAPKVLELARGRFDGLTVPPTSLEVSTERLRGQFPAMIKTDQQETVQRWCDWIDNCLAKPAAPVLVHGDFHPYNQIWDLETPRLLAVLDFESSGVAEPEFDFRVLPVFGPDLALFFATLEHYEEISHRKLDVERIMAQHVLNYLSDALWRTEAGFPLPPPGDSASAYVREAANRLAVLGLDPTHP